MRVWYGFLAVAAVSVSLISAEQSRRTGREACVVESVEEYYAVELDKDYDTRYHAEEIAEALYLGPLMREGDKEGLAHLVDVVRMRDVHDQVVVGTGCRPGT